MKMKRLTSLLLAATLSVSLFNINTAKVSATENDTSFEENVNFQYEIYPLPQSQIYSGSDFIITDEINLVIENGIDEATRNFIIEILQSKGLTIVESTEIVEDKTNIVIGIKASEGYVDNYCTENIEYDENIFAEEDAYLLKIDGSLGGNGTIAILGQTTDSAYYGLATLKMIFNQLEENEIQDVIYEDFADAKWRGFIEGFYGYPWSNEDRKSLMEFGGNFKMNSYIFAPKDDPYHNRQWRELYPEDKLAEIGELAEVGIKSKTQFVWAIHPGFSMINWNDYDNEIQTLLTKLEQLYSVGVRQFGLFMDDISTDQSLLDTDKHVKLVTDVANWVKAKGDCYSLVYCPPYYNQAWTGEKGKPYLRALANVPENVEIMWTGVDVCGQVVESEMQWPKDLIGRDTYMWLNWPVNGHNSARLMLGKGEVLHPGVHNVSGIVTNPLEYAELSKTAIFAVADYTWNTDDFDDDESWADSFKYINPEVAEEFHIIASHLSDPSPSSRNLVLEESEYLKEDLELFLNNYDSGTDIEEVGARLVNEFDIILNAIEVFDSEKNLNEDMKEEIKPWLNSLEYIVMACKSTVNSAIALRNSNMDEAWTELSKATSYNQTSKTFTTKKLGYPDVVVESGAKRLIPFARKLIDKLDAKVYMEMDPQASSRIPMASYNSNQLNLMVDGNEETYAYFKTLQAANDWYGVDLGKVIEVNDVEIVQGMNDTHHDRFHQGILEYSVDGQEWTAIGEERNEVRITETGLSVQARYIRYRAVAAGIPGGKPDLWTAVREITINKGESEVILYTNIKGLDNSIINNTELSSEIVNLSNITLKENEYLGLKLTAIERLADVACEASSEALTLEVSANGVEWEEAMGTSESRYVRLINKGKEAVTFDLNKLAVSLNKFEEVEITHDFGSIYSGTLENAFDKKLESKLWFGAAQSEGKYLQVDLGGVIDIDKIDLVIGDSEKDYFRNGNLQISLDGETWETVAELTGGSREGNFPTLKAPYRYRTVEGINKKGRYVRLISTTNNNAWFAINEILINDGVESNLNTNPALIANPEGELSNVSDSIIDKKLATFYTPQGDTLSGELLYKLSDYTEVGEVIILQSPTGISNAVVEVRDLNGWHQVGTLDNSYNSFDTSSFDNVLDVKLTWDGNKPIINEIITVKRSSENIPDEKPEPSQETKFNAVVSGDIFVGNNFEVKVSLNDLASEDMYSMQFEVEYDKNNLEFVTAKPVDIDKHMVNYKLTDDKLTVIVAGLGVSFKAASDIVKLEFKAVNESEETDVNIVAGEIANGEGQVEIVKDTKVTIAINSAIDKSELNSVIEEAKKIVENESDKYTEKSIEALREAIEIAEGVAENEEATIEQINIAKTALQTAIDNLVRVEKPEESADKTALKITIDYATELKENGALDGVVEPVVTEFNKALANALNVYSNEGATVEEIKNALDKLIEIIHMLEFKEGDKSQLDNLINTAEALNKDKYTQESWSNLEAVLVEANKVLADKNAMQEEIDQAVENLQNAIKNLEVVNSVNKSILESLINMVKDAEENKYIKSTWIPFAEALSKANSILADENTTQEKVNSAYNNLLRAYLSLRLVPDKSALEDLINKVNNLDLSKYTKASVKKLNTELKKANKVFNDENASKEEIAAATESLNVAVANLEGKLVSSDNSNNSGSKNNSTTNKGNLPNTGAATSTVAVLALGAALAGCGTVMSKKKRK